MFTKCQKQHWKSKMVQGFTGHWRQPVLFIHKLTNYNVALTVSTTWCAVIMIVGGNHGTVNVRLYLYGQSCKRRKYSPQKIYKKDYTTIYFASYIWYNPFFAKSKCTRRTMWDGFVTYATILNIHCEFPHILFSIFNILGFTGKQCIAPMI